MNAEHKNNLLLMALCLCIGAAITLVAVPQKIEITYNNTINQTNEVSTTINNTNTVLDKVWITREKSVQCQGFGMNESTLYNIEGSSMQPTLWPGDRLWVKKYDPKKTVVTGDIVVRLEADGGRTIHRVTRTYEQCYVTQGDNNQQEDGCEPYNTILAVVCGHTW